MLPDFRLQSMRSALATALAEEEPPRITPLVAETSSSPILHCLESPVRFSQSSLWNLQRRFYERKAEGAWAEGIVPHYVTSNAVIASAYAQVLHAFLHDCQAAGHAQPVTIVELGAGSGQFSFQCLRALDLLLEGRPVQSALPYRYILTDFAQPNVDFWRTHLAFEPGLANGSVDFACFDAVAGRELRLIHRTHITHGRPAGPMVVIANYLWDTIPNDYFQVKGGRLHECQVALYATSPHASLDDPGILPELETRYAFRPLKGKYYNAPKLDRLLAAYKTAYEEALVPFPFCALDCLERLAALSTGPVLMLSADKGFVDPEYLITHDLPAIAHHGSFSLMVNYDAFRRHFELEHGRFWSSGREGNSITVAAGLLPRGTGFVPHATQHAIAQGIGAYGPDDYFSLKKGMERNFAQFQPDELVAYIRASVYDPKAARRVLESLLPRLGEVDSNTRKVLPEVLQRAWDNYYFLGEEFDLAGLFAYVLAETGNPAEAAFFQATSQRLYEKRKAL